MKLSVLLFLVFLMLSSGSVFAQDYPKHTLHMRDGSTQKGTIKMKTGNRSLIFITETGEEVEISYNQIRSVSNNRKPSPTNPDGKTYRESDLKERGFLNITEAQFGLGVGMVKVGPYSAANPENSFGLRTVNGYQFSRQFSAGVGIGIETYSSLVLLPLTADLRFAFSPAATSVMLNANVGRSVNGTGGFVANPSLGIRTYISNKNAVVVSAGYKWFEAPVTAGWIRRQSVFHFVTIGAGLTF